MTSSWSTPDDIAVAVRRRWKDGRLLRSLASGESFEPVEVRLRGPRAAEIGDDLGAVQEWVRRLDTGRRGGTRYDLEMVAVGGRHIGRNRIPGRAVLRTFDQAWSLLGVAEEVACFETLLAAADDRADVVAWVLAHPHPAIALAPEWARVLAAYDWLDAQRGSGRRLREIDAPGVDTKVAERHRSVLAAMLGVPTSAAGFLAGLGLRPGPELIRIRVSRGLGLPDPLSEVAARAEELAALPLTPDRVIVCENETTYLTVPVPTGGAVVWGKGFEVDRVGRLPWLADVDVVYWGDLDTHGFAILDRLRAWLPQTRSVLMDQHTLVAHRERWGQEPTPTRARLTRLTPEENDVYRALVTDAYDERVRLEQERIDWAWALARLPGPDEHPSDEPVR